MVFIKAWIAIWLAVLLSCSTACTKIEDSARNVSEIEDTADTEIQEYDRYRCELYYPQMDQMLDQLGLTDVAYEEKSSKAGYQTAHARTYENGSYILAFEEKGKMSSFIYTRHYDEKKVGLYGSFSIGEKDRSEELSFMTMEEAETQCKKELDRLDIPGEFAVEDAYGLNKQCIQKYFSELSYGTKENMTEEREAYNFKFSQMCDNTSFYDGSVQKGVLEAIIQPEIVMTYSAEGLEYFSISGVVMIMEKTGKAELIPQEEVENMVVRAYGQSEDGNPKGVITDAEVLYARVPTKIKVGKKNRDLSEYECIPCWKITMQQYVTWDNTGKTELETEEIFLQGSTGERL